MDRRVNRRRFLKAGTLVGAVSIAGCPSDTPDAGQPTTEPVESGDKDPPADGTNSPETEPPGQERPVFGVVDTVLSGDEFMVGEELTITADVENSGGEIGEFELDLRIGSETVESQGIELDTNEETQLTFTHVFDRPGEFEIHLNTTHLGTVVVFKGFSEFVSVDGRSLTVGDERYYLIGANNCCSLTTWNPMERIDELLADMATLGMNVLRVRGYGCDTRPNPEVCFQYEPGEYGEYAFEVMDYLIHEANKWGIRLVIDLCNAWEVNLGGDIAQYVEWSSTADVHDDFFTDEECREAYKRYVEHMVTRENELTGRAYRGEPAIAVWSLCNEVHAKNEGSKDEVQAWINEMARFVKELDANQLVTPSHLGYYQDDQADEMGVDFIENHRSPHIDLCTFRVYNQNVGFQSHEESRDDWLSVNEKRVLPWITDHVEAVTDELDKPVMVEEWGWKAHRTADDAERQIDLRNQIYRSWVDLFIELDIDGALIWEQQTDEAYDSWGYEEEFALSYPQDAETLEIVGEYAERVGD